MNSDFSTRGNFGAAVSCAGQGRAANTHLVDSGEGFTWPWLFSSHTLLASSLPMADITLMSSMGQSSRSRERTRDRCVPRLRWIPEHSMQMRAPRLRLAQSGSAGQGTHQLAQGMPNRTFQGVFVCGGFGPGGVLSQSATARFSRVSGDAKP